jgi:hypothetical protein
MPAAAAWQPGPQDAERIGGEAKVHPRAGMTTRPHLGTLTAIAAVAGIMLALTGRSSHSSLARADSRAISDAIERTAPVPHMRTSASAAKIPAKVLTGTVQKYCKVCHNESNREKAGGLSLEGFDVVSAADRAANAERMIQKLRAHMMPPPGMPRPTGDTLLALVETLEAIMDKAAARNPNPGTRSVQRLNRAEYERAVREVLELDVDAARWLPADQMSANFDNIADVQALSPTLLGAYLNAARDISRIAVGDANAPSTTTTYSVSEFVSQHPRDQLDGAPYGTRGGIVVTHDFPADGLYAFRMTFTLGNGAKLEDIDISVDGERIALLQYERGVPMKTDPIFIRAGQRRVSAAFVRKQEGPYEDLIRPHDYSQAGTGNSGAGTTSLPHLVTLAVAGPDNPSGVSDTPSRRKVFSCRPTSSDQERGCAREIIIRIGEDAYRRPLEPREIEPLMSFYETGAANGRGFEAGVAASLRAILASPRFVFRPEREPPNTRPGQIYRIADLDLASRLSFFLWGTPPDDELLAIAGRGKLSERKTLERQTRRMLADPRSEALATRFASQWLRLQDLDKITPDAFWFPNYDQNLAKSMRRETELFFDNLVREDRSILELFRADYTFVNERLARHYGIQGVLGRDFQRVVYPDETRRGVLGHGSVLVQTSLGNRTSPVLRGKWVMEVLLGTTPPPPPPGVPDLEETSESKDGAILTTRQRMEQHRTSAVCKSCHQYMDPIGLALDNFDVTGKWRYRENGMPLDTRGQLYDGTEVSTPGELANALLARPIPLVRTFTENLLAYALGRRVEYYDQATIRAIASAAEKNDYRISSFILGVVQSAPFRMRRAEAATTDTGNAEPR